MSTNAPNPRAIVAPFPPASATREQIAEWHEGHILCDCQHFRRQHTDKGCCVAGCDCDAFEDPIGYEAPPIANGPSLMCNACGRVRINIFNGPFCKTCSAQIGECP